MTDHSCQQPQWSYIVCPGGKRWRVWRATSSLTPNQDELDFLSARPSRCLGETSALIPPPCRGCLHCCQDASPVVRGLDVVVDILLIPVYRAHEQDVTKAEEEETRGSLVPPLLHPGGSSAAALPESLDDVEQSQSPMEQVKSPHSVVVAICAPWTSSPSESFGAPTGVRSAMIDSAFGTNKHDY